ncbi:MAG: branched-chain amino acid ABC transporter permease [Bradymonadia bacterium]
MTRLIQTLLDGVAVGSLYALIALGYTMVYGILQFINFAHSDIFMVGAWAAFLIAKAAGYAGVGVEAPLYGALLSLLGAMAFCGTLGFLIERFAYRPLRGAARLNVLITAIGVALFIENLGQKDFVFGTQPQKMPQLLPDTTLFTLFDVRFGLVDLTVIGVAFALMAALQWLVFKTKLGRAMRAVSHNIPVASLMGIDVNRVISFTFVLGSMLAAAAGFLFVMKYPGALKQPADSTWILLGLKCFVAAVVGGIGNIRGAVLGGLLIGCIEMFGAAYLSPHLRDVYVFSLLILVLLFRPTGLLGRATVEKV